MLSSLKKKWGPWICAGVPLSLWHRLCGVELLIPHWHAVSDEKVPHISGLYQLRTIREFQSDIDFFLKYYRPVSLDDVIDHLDGVRSLPKRCFLPTFDDGFREVYDVVAPLLHRRGVPAVFFLITSAIDNAKLCYPQKKSLLLTALEAQRGSNAERMVSQILIRPGMPAGSAPRAIRDIYYRQRHVLDELAPVLGCDFAAYVKSAKPYITSQQVVELMKMGFHIGAHSIDHPLFPELPLEEQIEQTRQSMALLSERFQYECRTFSFPYMDLGISQEYFAKAFAQQNLKVTFGTGGMRHHFHARNLSRFTMENSKLPTKVIVADAFARSLLLPNSLEVWVKAPAVGLPLATGE